MTWFANASIRKKLIAIQLLTTLAGLALYGLFTIINETRLQREALTQSTQTLTQMLATNCAAPLDFQDAPAAEEILASAEAEDQVVNAWIYDAQGTLFAKYSRPGSQPFIFLPMVTEFHTGERDFLTVSKNIVARGETIGVVSVRVYMGRFRAVLFRSITLAGMALAIVMAVSFLLSILLQKSVSAPINSLVDVVSKVSAHGDYSIRVHSERKDEIGVLCNGFDEMLRTILQRENERRQAETTLRESERKYRELVEHANSIILRFRPDGQITFLNEFGQRFFGYSEAEIVGRHMVGSLVPDTDSTGRDMYLLMEQICVRPSEFEHHVNENMRRNGERVWIAWTNKVAYDAKGDVEGVLSIGTDITERRKAEIALRENEARYRALFEESPVSLWEEDFSEVKTYLDGLRQKGITDLRNHFEVYPDTLRQCADRIKVLDVNRATLELLQYDRREEVCTHLSRVFREDSYDLLHEELIALASGNKMFHTETINHTRLGHPIHVNMTVAIVPGHEDSWARVFVSLTDISDRIRAEEDLRALNEVLEKRVEERTIELALAKDRAESADRLKSAFLAAMSHELRTPLNSIIGFTGIVLQGLAGPLNDEQTKQLSMVQGSARHLLDLINDVLDLSKIEAGQLEVDAISFDVRESIDKAVRLVSPLAQKKGLELSAQIAPEVGELVSDRRRFEQVLINLLNNAIKFTDKGHVRIECAHNGNGLVTRVIDSGIGIQPEDRPKLFHAFQQIDSGLARAHEGTGLGLSICKRLVEKMGGQIWVESEWTVGSVFAFTIPFAPTKETT